MRLRQIEINGFKSFHDRATLEFPGRIVAVVGPNGCGKSNICDAVTWVLGEQSAKSLRSQTMDDVIFSGSARRRPLGLAEVTLTLEGDGAPFDESGGVVTISRRVFRDGHSEYVCNGRKVRLRDIQDLILGTGMGMREYSVIQQGKIDLILSNRPQDRRRLIEEAAGITKYKLRKRAAENKLLETTANLERISDLLTEIERQCNSLKRQASKAERWKKLETELGDVRRRLYAFEARRLRDNVDGLLDRHSATLAREGDVSARTGANEASVAILREEIDQAAARHGSHREELQSLRGSIATREETLRSAEARISESCDRLDSLDQREKNLSDEEARLAATVDETSRRLTEARSALDQLRQQLEHADHDRRDSEQKVKTLEQDVERLRSDLLRSIGRAGEERNRAHDLEITAEKNRFQLQKLEEAISRLEERRRERLTERDQLTTREDELRQLVDEARRTAEALSRERDQLIREEKQLRDTASRARSEAWAAGHKIESLEMLAARKEKPFRQQAEAINRAGGITDGLLAEHLDVVPGSEPLVDLALADLADLPVVRDGGRGSELLKRVHEAGRQGLAFLAADVDTGSGQRLDEIQRGFLLDAGAVPLSDRVRPRSQAPVAVANLLDDCWLAPDLGQAAALARRFPCQTFFTPDLHQVRGAVFRAPGPDGAEGPLTIRREITQLDARRQEEESRSREATARADQLAERIPILETRLREESEKLEKMTREGALVAADRRRADDEIIRTEKEVDVQRRESAVFTRQLERIEVDRREAENRIQESNRLQDDLEKRVEARSRELTNARTDLGPRAARSAGLRTEVGVASERLASLEREVEAGRRQSDGVGQRIGELVAERNRLIETRDQSQQVRERTVYQLREQLEELEQLQDLVAEEELRLLDERRRLEKQHELLDSDRASLERIRNQRHEVEMEIAAARSALERLGELCRRDLACLPDALPDPGEISSLELAELRRGAEDMSGRLERMGTVNLLALEEFEEADQRRDFLRTQHDDLVSSIASLRDTIRKINRTSTERFVEAFEFVNENFRQLFGELFRGGTAEMRLMDESDPLETGIEITAQPPGKNNQSILLLSGGEKALTAIALLMAIFRYRPSPFCILDEVDAPLDEPNIDRFGRILQAMTGETQFIVITHSKRTMEMADVLYGVTMEEAGCSKLVSVRLN